MNCPAELEAILEVSPWPSRHSGPEVVVQAVVVQAGVVLRPVVLRPVVLRVDAFALGTTRNEPSCRFGPADVHSLDLLQTLTIRPLDTCVPSQEGQAGKDRWAMCVYAAKIPVARRHWTYRA
jgi:hypothetical protein